MSIITWLKSHYTSVWWLFLILFFSIFFIYPNYSLITSGQVSILYIFIFLIWAGLLISPLFKEVSLFGVQFKREFEEFKTAIRNEILQLKIDLHNTISNQIFITTPPPPSDKKIEADKPVIERIIDEQLDSRGISKSSARELPSIPKKVQDVMVIRYSIEKEIKRLWLKDHEMLMGRPPPLNRMLQDLRAEEIINPEIISGLREIWIIANRIVHGEDYSDTQINFILEVGPSLIASLKGIK